MGSEGPLSRLPLPSQAVLLTIAALVVEGISSWHLQRHLSGLLMREALKAQQVQVQEAVAQFDATLQQAERSVASFAGLISAIDPSAPGASTAAERLQEQLKQDPDGAWRSRVDRFQATRMAGIWIPAGVAREEPIRAFFGQAEPITAIYGQGVASGLLENTWVLPLSGGELIFWPSKASFIRHAAAGLDYRPTPWVQLTAPGRDPEGLPRWTRPDYDPAAREWMISVVAPFRQQGQWAGSVGHDLLIRNLLRWLVPLHRPSHAGLMARPLYVVGGDGRLLVQEGSRSPFGGRLPEGHRRVLETPPSGARVFTVPMGADHLIVARLPRLEARAVYRVDGKAIAALVSQDLNGLQLAVTLFMALLLLVGFLLVSREISFRRREQHLLEERKQQLEQVVNSRTRELAEANRELSRLATLDGLTGVGNRRSFEQKLARDWADSRRRQEPLALVMVDVDHFKLYNDSLGHPAGDDCLRAVAAVLQSCLRRPEDGTYRYGGEEFVLLLANTDAEGAAHCAEQARRTLAELALPHPLGLVTASLGVASVVPPPDSEDHEAAGLVAAADAALYRAKQQGRDRVELA